MQQPNRPVSEKAWKLIFISLTVISLLLHFTGKLGSICNKKTRN